MGLVAAGALLLALLAVRDAAVLAFAERRPELAAALWPKHPRVVTELGLGEIGRSTAAGRTPDPGTLERLRLVARRAPLAAEPLLVAGTDALSRGQVRRAELLLAEASRRDPRLPAARYLLADLYLRQQRTAEGLSQIAALIRRLPKAAAPLTPALAAFATQPGAAPQVRAILKGNAELRDKVLSTLAADPANSALVLELAAREPPSARIPDWQTNLVRALLKAGDYRKAYELWAGFSGVRAEPRPSLFNPRLEASRAPPPFNWTLASAAAGVAEPASGGGLHVLFYGREPATLASQLLLLEPGTYRLRYRASGLVGEPVLAWAVTCLPSNRLLGEHRLEPNGAWSFAVPAGCRAQELQLRGLVAEAPRTTDATLTGLELARAEGR